jgi:flagellar capping protein FliD
VQAKDGTKVYGNEAGLSLLNTCQDLQTDIQMLKIRADASDRRAEEVQGELDQLTDMVDALRESSKGYHVVRNRFLDSFKKNRLNIKSKQLKDKIISMNKTIHSADATTDALLYIDGSRRDVDVFKCLYGLSPLEVMKFRELYYHSKQDIDANSTR